MALPAASRGATSRDKGQRYQRRAGKCRVRFARPARSAARSGWASDTSRRAGTSTCAMPARPAGTPGARRRRTRRSRAMLGDMPVDATLEADLRASLVTKELAESLPVATSSEPIRDRIVRLFSETRLREERPPKYGFSDADEC